MAANGYGNARVTAEIAQACQQWLDSLAAEQKARGTFDFLDGERIFWYYPPVNRHGLPLRDMDHSQRKLAYRIMESSLAPDSYQKACQIIDHELVLGPLEQEEGHVTFHRDPELYYWTIFGEPGGDGPWGWRAEGHHISLHINAWKDQVISITPFFFGANPAEVRQGPKQGLRILDKREDLAFELVNSLDREQKAKAIIRQKAPWDILMYNASRAVVHDNEGLAGSQMSGTQKETLMALISEYVNQVRSEIAQDKMAELQQQGLDDFRVVWAGGTDRSQDHYYRIHGGNFIVEFDNIQNANNHIHSVWRDVANDFAEDVMRDSRLMYQVL